jgi:mono/diheme cytochrome c family protein
MRTNIGFTLASMLAVGTIAAAPAVAANADPQAGQLVYDTRCARCHTADAGRFKAPLAEISGLIRSERIRPHRFTRTDDQIRDLADYVRTVREGR